MEEDYSKNYYLENKKVMDERSKEWKIKNKKRWNEYQAEYKRRKYHENKLKNSQNDANSGGGINQVD